MFNKILQFLCCRKSKKKILKKKILASESGPIARARAAIATCLCPELRGSQAGYTEPRSMDHRGPFGGT